MKQKARIQCNKILNLINELGGVCYLTNKELSDRTGIATRTVERRKLDLLKSGEVRERDNQGKGRVIYILRQEPKSGEVGSIDSRKSGEVAKIAEAKSGEVVTSTKSGHYKKSGEVAVANCVILHKSGEVGPKRIINNIHTNNTYYLYSNPFIVSNDSIKSETQNKEMDSLCSSPFVVYRNPLEKEISDGYEYYQKCVDNYFTSYWHRQYQVRLDLLFHGISKLEPGQIAEVLKNVKSKFLLELLDRKIIKSNLKNKIYRLYRELLQWYKIIKSIPYPDRSFRVW